MFLLRFFTAALLLSGVAKAANPWDQPVLFKAPQTYPAPDFAQDGLESLFYDGLPYEGKPTRVFAYIGIPEHAAGTKVPGMVLVHGGGGTAFPEWVRLWNSRGYAAIAMDTCGCLPAGEHAKRPRHEFGGPPGWGGFAPKNEPLEDQWAYHAVADVLLAHSLLRSRDGVDATRIGLTGISWGGYLTCLAASVDDRFRFAAPVYGCGFLTENSTWLSNFRQMGAEATALWRERWDPSSYLARVRMPMLWVDGTNDFAFPLDSLQKSYRLPSGPRALCLRVRMPHGQGAGEKPEEIFALAEHLLKGGPALPQLSASTVKDSVLSVTYTAANPPAKAELNFTRDTGEWQKRLWETAPAELHPETQTASGQLPEGARVAYLNLLDAQGRVVSSEHVELPAP